METAERTGATVSGPVPLPTEKNVYCVIRSPFKDKDSREHFEIRTHKRLIDIHQPTPEDGRLAPAPRPSARRRRHRDPPGRLTMAGILAEARHDAVFLEDGRVERVTVLEAGPCPSPRSARTSATATTPSSSRFGASKEKPLTKAEPGHLKKAGAPPRATSWSSATRPASCSRRQVKVEAFEKGETRQGLRRLEGQGLPGHDQAPQLQPRPRRHGSHNVRAPGSIGASRHARRACSRASAARARWATSA